MPFSASHSRLLGLGLALLSAGLLSVGTVLPAHAQTAPWVAGPVYAHALPDAPRSPVRNGAPVRVESNGAAATFIVVYDGFPSEARAAFQRAVDLWADFVVSDVPIRVDATWTAFDNENTLGAAGPFIAQYEAGDTVPSGFQTGVWYPLALVNAATGRDQAPSTVDIDAEFNAAFDRWHFGTDSPGANQFDFSTVVLHELAHGLGFIGALTADGGTGTLVPTSGARAPFAFDLLARDCEGNAALDTSRYPRPSDELGDLLTGGALYLSGPTIDGATRADAPAPLYAPDSWNPGSSYSHLDERTFPLGGTQALMTPFFAASERALSPGALTCAVMADLGWTLAGECDSLIEVQSPVLVDLPSGVCAGTTPPGPGEPTEPPTPNLETFRLDDFGPRSGALTSSTTLTFSLFFGTDTAIQVRLYDSLGRVRLARTLTAPTQTIVENIPLDLSSLRLAAGTYFVTFTGVNRQVVEKITVVR